LSENEPPRKFKFSFIEPKLDKEELEEEGELERDEELDDEEEDKEEEEALGDDGDEEGDVNSVDDAIMLAP
jgi:hypothetical protein